MTQTSSPGGGWQGRLSAFLHVHRGSRASSRKSSRASDASDLSELGGPWLNLPLLLLSSAANVGPEDLDMARDPADVSIQVSEATPDASSPTTPSQPTVRRRSFYNFPFFLRQDAVENHDEGASPPVPKRGASLHPAPPPEEAPKPKRGGSLIRRKPADRTGSVKVRGSGSPLVPKRQAQEPHNGTDVSILVTEPSPEAPIPRPTLHRQQSESTVVHVLVHRESEEYNIEDGEDGGNKQNNSEHSS